MNPENSRVVALEAHDDSVSVGKGFLRLNRYGGPETGYYWAGDFIHPLGLVSVYRQHDVTRLDFVHNGRMHIRTWRKYWGDRTINRLAREFVSDIAGLS